MRAGRCCCNHMDLHDNRFMVPCPVRRILERSRCLVCRRRFRRSAALCCIGVLTPMDDSGERCPFAARDLLHRRAGSPKHLDSLFHLPRFQIPPSLHLCSLPHPSQTTLACFFPPLCRPIAVQLTLCFPCLPCRRARSLPKRELKQSVRSTSCSFHSRFPLTARSRFKI